MPGLAEKVMAAANHLEAGGVEGDVVEETPLETEAPETDDTPGDDDPAANDDLDEASIEEAKTLYKALKDPQQATAVVAALAGKMGLLGKEAPVTKAEVKEAKKDVRDILKSALGPEYQFLSDKLGTALDEVFEQERTSQAASIQELNNQQIARDTSVAMTELAAETKGESRKYEAKMVELSTKLLPGPGMGIKEYLKVLYTQATAGRQVAIQKNQLNDKIRKNANDVAGRLRSGGGQREETTFDPNKKYTLKQSVALAAAEIQRQNSKGK